MFNTDTESKLKILATKHFTKPSVHEQFFITTFCGATAKKQDLVIPSRSVIKLERAVERKWWWLCFDHNFPQFDNYGSALTMFLEGRDMNAVVGIP